MTAPRLGSHIGATNLYIKNDAVCMPTLSFKDRVVAVALANAQAFGFDTVGCSSTGNLPTPLPRTPRAWASRPTSWSRRPRSREDSQHPGLWGHAGALDGNYDHVNRLSSQIADRYNWGFVNVNLRPFYAEGSKTVGFEIAEQLGWRLPDNVVVPMAGGSLITKIRKAFNELIALGLVEDKPVRFFGAQATGCSPIATAVKNGTDSSSRSARTPSPARLLSAILPTALRGARHSRDWRLGRDVSDVEIVSAIQELAETEGIFTETAGGVTTAVTARLYAHERIQPDELTVTCITGNGLKTTDVSHGAYDQLAPFVSACGFRKYLAKKTQPGKKS